MRGRKGSKYFSFERVKPYELKKKVIEISASELYTKHNIRFIASQLEKRH